VRACLDRFSSEDVVRLAERGILRQPFVRTEDLRNGYRQGGDRLTACRDLAAEQLARDDMRVGEPRIRADTAIRVASGSRLSSRKSAGSAIASQNVCQNFASSGAAATKRSSRVR
jgi:hypothetical protein